MTWRKVAAVTAALLLPVGCTSGNDAARTAAPPMPERAVSPPPGASCPARGDRGLRGDAPDFADVTLGCLRTGPDVNLGRLGGDRPVLLNLWASWCLPCQKEMPRLQRAYHLANGQMLFLGVDTKDAPDSARSFLNAVRASYPHVIDEDGVVLRLLHGAALPVTVVINPAGAIVYKKFGELSQDDLADAFTAAGITVTPASLSR